jgi:hypothetical protein
MEETKPEISEKRMATISKRLSMDNLGVFYYL